MGTRRVNIESVVRSAMPRPPNGWHLSVDVMIATCEDAYELRASSWPANYFGRRGVRHAVVTLAPPELARSDGDWIDELRSKLGQLHGMLFPRVWRFRIGTRPHPKRLLPGPKPR